MKTKEAERRSIALRLAPMGVSLLAEKVESYFDFKLAKEYGYKYFQGYFFGHPEIFSGRDIPGYTVNYLNMLRESSRAELDYDKLEQIFRRDVALSFKLLKFINSSFFGFKNKISSVKQALVLDGAQRDFEMDFLAGFAEHCPGQTQRIGGFVAGTRAISGTDGISNRLDQVE